MIIKIRIECLPPTQTLQLAYIDDNHRVSSAISKELVAVQVRAFAALLS